MLAQMIDQRPFLYLAKHFPTAHRDLLEIRNEKEKNKESKREKERERKERNMPRQTTKRVCSETRLLRANGFRRKLLSASDVVSLRSDYFAFQISWTDRDVSYKILFPTQN